MSYPWQKGERRGFAHFSDGKCSIIQVDSDHSMTKIHESEFEFGQQENTIREFLDKPLIQVEPIRRRDEDKITIDFPLAFIQSPNAPYSVFVTNLL